MELKLFFSNTEIEQNEKIKFFGNVICPCYLGVTLIISFAASFSER